MEDDDAVDSKEFAQNLAGYGYQLKLLLLFLWRGWKKEYIFKLETEAKNYEKFDDLIFYYKKKEEEDFNVICLQAKHSRDDGVEFKYDDFVSQTNDKTKICNLRKYFISFQDIRHKVNNQLPKELILCNNHRMPDSRILGKNMNTADGLVFKEECLSNDLQNDIFYDSTGKWECFKLKQINQEVANILNKPTYLYLLAENLTNCIIKSEGNGYEVKLYKKNYLFFIYQDALINDKIFEAKKKSQNFYENYYIFSEEFLNNDIANNDIQNLHKNMFDNFGNYLSKKLGKLPVFEDENSIGEEMADNSIEKSDDIILNLVSCFLHEKKISKSLVDRCNKKYDENIFIGTNVIQFLPKIKQHKNDAIKEFYSYFLTRCTMEILKTKVFSFVENVSADLSNITNDILNVIMNNEISIIDLKKYENIETRYLVETLFDEVYDIDDKTIHFKETYLNNNYELPEEAEMFRTMLKERILRLSLPELLNCKIKINTWNEIEVDNTRWFITKLEALAKEIMIAFQNVKENSKFILYDKTQCINNGTHGLLENMIGDVFFITKEDKAEKYFAFVESFVTNNFISEKAKIFKEKLENQGFNNFNMTILKKRLFNVSDEKEVEWKLSNLIKQLNNAKVSQNNILVYDRTKHETHETAGLLEILNESVFENDESYLKFNDAFVNEKEPSDNKELLKKQLRSAFRKCLKNVIYEDAIEKFNTRQIKLTDIPFCLNHTEMDKLSTQLITASENNQKALELTNDLSDAVKNLAGSNFISISGTKKIKFKSTFLCQKWTKEAAQFKKSLKTVLTGLSKKSKKKEKFNFNDLENFEMKIVKTSAAKIRKQRENAESSWITIVKDFANEIGLNIFKSFEKSEKTFDFCLEDYDEYKKTTVSNIINVVFVSVFDTELEIKKFKKTFFICDQWFKSAEIFREILERNDANFEMLKNFTFDSGSFPFCCETICEPGNIDEDINEYKNKLLIATTPGEKKLFEIMEKEVSKEFNLINDKMFAKDLLIEVENWAKQKDQQFLTEKEVEKLFTTLKRKLYSLAVSGVHFLYREKLRNYEIIFKETEISWQKFLLPPNTDCLENEKMKKQILILRSKTVTLTAIKIEQYLKAFSYYDNVNTVIFQMLSELLLLEKFVIENKKSSQAVTSAFASEKNNDLLIIVDDSTPKLMFQCTIFFNKLSEIITRDEKKKIVLLVNSSKEEDNQLVEFLKENIDEELLLDESDLLKLADIQNSMDIILNKKIKFQGNLIPLIRIIDNITLLNEKMDSLTLEKFLENRLEIAPPPSHQKTYQKESYIQRLLGPIKLDAKFVEACQIMEHNFFVFENISEIVITNILKAHDVYENQGCSIKEFLDNTYGHKMCYIYSYSYLSYYEECQLSERLFNRYHVFTVEKGSNTDEKYVYVNEKFFLHYTRNHKVVLLTDSAGMGKSTTLSYFIENYTEALWILRINLIESAEVFSKFNEISLLTDKGFIFNYSNKVINYETLLHNSLINSMTSNESPKTFENYIFDYMFKNNKVLILFDGYDEINEKSRKGLLLFIQRLKGKTNNTIWITSRSNFHKEMEDELQISAYSFKPMSSDDQRQLLINVWSQQWGRELINGQKLHMNIYASSLIQTFSGKDIAITSPLQLKMLAEIFMQNNDPASSWTGCFNFIENDQICDDNILSCKHRRKIKIFDKARNLHDLYDEFVRKKIEKYFERIFGSSCDTATELKQPLTEKCYKVHCVLALKTMTDQDELLDILNLEESTEFAYHDVGIVNSTGNQQAFVHYSYAEYFSAYFLFQKLIETPEKREKIFNIIGHVLKNDVPVFSYCMKHLMWNKSQNYEVSDMIKDINLLQYKEKSDQYTIIKWMLNDANYDHCFPKIDNLDKTYLHYAVESKNTVTIVYALLHFYTLLLRNEKTRAEFFPMFLQSLMPFMDLLTFRNVNAKTALFYLSEYIKFKDKMGNSALFYAKENTKVTALFEDTIQVADEYSGVENETHNIKNMLERIPEHSRNYELANILSKNAEIRNIFQNLFCSLSFSSIYLILENVEPSLLDLLLEGSSNSFTFFDNICAKNDMTNEEKLNLFKIWWNESTLKKKALNSILLASTVNDCVDVFKYFIDFIEKENQEVPIRECFSTACQARNNKIVEILLQKYPKEISILSPIHLALDSFTSLSIINSIVNTINPDINKKNEEKQTPLTKLVAKRSQIHLIKYFLCKGAMIDIPDNQGKTAWDYALEIDDDSLTCLFLEYVKLSESNYCIHPVKEYYSNPIFSLDKNDSNDPLLIDAVVQIRDYNEKRLLDYAKESNNYNLIEVLLDLGGIADVKYKHLINKKVVRLFLSYATEPTEDEVIARWSNIIVI